MTHGSQGARFSRLLAEFMAALHRHSQGETLHLISETGITLPQMVAMQHIHFCGWKSVTGLQEMLRLSPSATSHLVDRLVDRGYLTRTEDADDRRLKRLEITESGRELVDRMSQSRVRELDEAIAALDPELSERLFTVLEQVVTRLQQHDQESPR